MSEIFDTGTLSRYDMSYGTYRRLQKDHIRFEEKYTERFSNGFICRILVNYMCYAQENFLEAFEDAVAESFTNKEHDEYAADDRISFTRQLTDKLLEFDFSSDENFKKRKLITYLLEQFTLLPLSERERIYCYDKFETLKKVMENGEILIVKMTSGKEYELKPVDIRIDENTLSYYLIGYSRPKGSKDDFESYGFKISRITECRSRHRKFEISYKEIIDLKELNDRIGSAYIEKKNLDGKEMEKSVVRLTKKGYEILYLRKISHQRPIPVTAPEKIILNGEEFYELTFDCAHYHIRNYFFSFGGEAEIISPESLRELFMNEFRRSMERYT